METMMVMPSALIDEWDKLVRLVRQRPFLTTIACVLVVAGCAVWLMFWPHAPFDRPSNAVGTITMPGSGASVDEVESIAGTAATTDGLLYPVVTPLLSGVPYIAGAMLTVHGDGTFSGHARFGDINTAAGTKFDLRIVSSRAPRQEGPLRGETTRPVSQTITVERR